MPAKCYNIPIHIYLWKGFFYEKETDTHFGGSLRFHDAEVAALCAPRKLIIRIGKADPVFNFETALPELDRIGDYFSAYGVPENLNLSLWDGAHTYSDSDECFNLFFNTLKN